LCVLRFSGSNVLFAIDAIRKKWFLPIGPLPFFIRRKTTICLLFAFFIVSKTIIWWFLSKRCRELDFAIIAYFATFALCGDNII
jgi:hypothetical protein